MSIKIGFNGASLNKPGAYSALKIAPLTGFPLTATGIVGIIGPADGGAPGFAGPFSQANIQRAKEEYASGPIADAFDLLVNGSGDERIVNGASSIYVFKTNQSTQSELTLGAWGKLKSLLYGLEANKVAAELAIAEAEVLPTLSFTYIAPSTDATFGCRVNGGSAVSVSILSTDTAAQAATKIDGLAGISATEDAGVITIVVSDSTPSGAGASLEIFDGVGTDALTTIGIAAGSIGVVIESSVEGKIQYTFSHPTKEDEESEAIGGNIALAIGYLGTTATVTITETTLTTSVAGGLGSNLNITLADYNNIQELADYIDSLPGYSCSTDYVSASIESATVLDNVSALGICSSAADLKPGRVKADSVALASVINSNSALILAEQVSNIGLPAVLIKTYLTGAVKGSASNTDFQNGFDAFKTVRMNSVVPLIAKDGAEEGYGTYDFDSVAAQLLSHIKWGWSTLGKSERNGFIGREGNKTVLKALCKSFNTGYISVCGGQKVRRTNAAGTLTYLPEWALPCIAASMQQGSDVGEPITYKYINALGVEQESSWNPKEDYSEMIDAGLLFVESVDSGGYRFVVGNTSYGKDSNFVWNRISVVEAGGYVAYDLRTALEQKFTGIKASTGIATSIQNFIVARMTDYLASDIIVADDSAAKGFKDLSVVVDGNTAVINVTVYPVQGIDFTISTIYLESATQTA